MKNPGAFCVAGAVTVPLGDGRRRPAATSSASEPSASASNPFASATRPGRRLTRASREDNFGLGRGQTTLLLHPQHRGIARIEDRRARSPLRPRSPSAEGRARGRCRLDRRQYERVEVEVDNGQDLVCLRGADGSAPSASLRRCAPFGGHRAERACDLLQPDAIGIHRHKVGLGEVAVVEGFLLRPERERSTPSPRPSDGSAAPPILRRTRFLSGVRSRGRSPDRAIGASEVLHLAAGTELARPHPVSQRRWRRCASSPPPCARQKPRRDQDPTQLGCIVVPAPRCGCRARIRSPQVGPPHGCSRPVSSRHRGSFPRRPVGGLPRVLFRCRAHDPHARAVGRSRWPPTFIGSAY